MDSKYVLIANKVIDSTGATKSTIIPTINDAFKNDELIKAKFEKVREFKINKDITFSLYERKSLSDKIEADYWKEKFKNQSEKILNYLKKELINI